MRTSSLAVAALLAGSTAASAALDPSLTPMAATEFMTAVRGNTLVVEHADGTRVAQYVDMRGKADRHGRSGDGLILGGPGAAFVQDGRFCTHWNEDVRDLLAGPTCLQVARSDRGYVLADAVGAAVAWVTIFPGLAME